MIVSIFYVLTKISHSQISIRDVGSGEVGEGVYATPLLFAPLDFPEIFRPWDIPVNAYLTVGFLLGGRGGLA